MQLLTPKQKIVFQAIKEFFSENGEMPTVRELQDRSDKMGLKLKSLRSFICLSEANWNARAISSAPAKTAVSNSRRDE
ncbi:MAG: hypothetical protein WDN67_01185 [Candidatus Moraniibacteriota bacterium]